MVLRLCSGLLVVVLAFFSAICLSLGPVGPGHRDRPECLTALLWSTMARVSLLADGAQAVKEYLADRPPVIPCGTMFIDTPGGTIASYQRVELH